MANRLVGVPGISAAQEAGFRRIWRGSDAAYLPGSFSIDAATSRDPGNTGNVDTLRAGLLMGLRTADSQYAPSILGVTTNNEAAGSASIEAAAGVITELVRRVGATGTFNLTGPPAAAGTVVTETVTYSAASGTTITVTAITNAFVAGSFIQPTDGSQTPISFIDEGYGIKVTDDNAASLDREFAPFPVAGTVDASQLINWPSDTSLRAWLEARLSNFILDHGF